MNDVFALLVGIALLFTPVADLKSLRQAERGERVLYGILGLLAAGSYVVYLLKLNVPMPIDFQIHQVAPVVHDLVMKVR